MKCSACGKRVIQAQAHITINEDGGRGSIFHLDCWLAMPERSKGPR